jgi:diguanylate cyclase (GGDEF)-like protein
VIILDVDHFKRFNDTYGHLAGDDCLLKVASTLRASLRRPGDVVARYGGEEFACILAETDLEQAMYLAQTLVQNVRKLSLPHQCSDVADVVTISAGVCCHLPGSGGSVAGLVSKADALLYRAKRNGRDQVAGGYLDPTDMPAV